MKRSIGPRVAQVAEIAARIPTPCTARQIGEHMPSVAITNVNKFCSRAVGHQLLTVDRSATPKTYMVAEGWRERIEQYESTPAARAPRVPKEKPAPPAPVEWHHLQTVWRNI